MADSRRRRNRPVPIKPMEVTGLESVAESDPLPPVVTPMKEVRPPMPTVVAPPVVSPAPPPKRWIVVGKKPKLVRMNGCMTQIPPGKIVTEGRYDIVLLRDFGVELKELED